MADFDMRADAMSDDFCLLHGYEYMKSQMGNPIPYCEQCERSADAMSDDTVLTEIERRALEHIRRHGDDRNLRAKSWKEIKRSLSRKGYLKRRIGDWAWIVSEG